MQGPFFDLLEKYARGGGGREEASQSINSKKVPSQDCIRIN